MRRRHLLLTATLALAAGATAAQASAATLHASPDSTRATLPCAADTPCRVDYALLAAAVGDDVALASGDYYSTGTTPWAGLPDVKTGVAVHGTPGQPLPVLHGQMAVSAVPFIRIASQASLSDVALDVGANPGVTISYAVTLSSGALLERSRVSARGTAGVWMIACSMVGGTVRSTACLGSGPGRVDGISAASGQAATYQVRNATAVTTAQTGEAVRVVVSTQASAMSVTNTIARGTTADLVALAGLAGGNATMTVDHSNWNSQSTTGAGTPRIVPTIGNQFGPTAAVPRFVDAGAGDYRIAAGSPTIDAGATDPLNGTLALGGAPRTVGAATDIGAYEFVPPPAPPAPLAPPAPTPAATASPAPDALAPVLGGLRLGRSWRLATTVRFTLSEPARVTLAVSRPVAGRRSGGRCRRATVTLRGTRCTIPNARGAIVVAGKAGANTVRLARTLTRTRTLKPGPYLLTVRAVDASGNRGTARTARFTIAR